MPFEGTRVPGAGRLDWRDQGACRDHDPRLFFPEGDDPSALVQAGTAKAICQACPVAGVCLKWALSSSQSYGIWGGLTTDERQAVLRVRAQVALTLGTARHDQAPASTELSAGAEAAA